MCASRKCFEVHVPEKDYGIRFINFGRSIFRIAHRMRVGSVSMCVDPKWIMDSYL